jgi:hypothetical protein
MERCNAVLYEMKRKISKSKHLEFESLLYYLPSMGSYTCYLIARSLSFLYCKVNILMLCTPPKWR